jgi:hypothetical protein
MTWSRLPADLIEDARKRADAEGAIDRHPSADVQRYLDEGKTELYDIVLEVRGRQFYRKNPPHTITTLAGTTRYALPSDFYELISVRRSGAGGENLEAFTPTDEPWLREPSASGLYPSHYELQPGYIELLPSPMAGVSIIVEYVPHCGPLDNDGTPTAFDGINGWEKYLVLYAAREMCVKDDELQLAAKHEADMANIASRVRTQARRRDAFRPERVKDSRGGYWGWRLR